MKMKLRNSLVVGFMAILGGIGLTGCGDDVTEIIDDGTYIIGSEVITYEIEVRKDAWHWDPDGKRYYAVADIDGLNEDSYEYGIIDTSVYLTEYGYNENGDPIDFEVQKKLPTVTYYDDKGFGYLETISCDAYFEDGKMGAMTFYIQTSDGEETTPVLTKYIFKLTLLKSYVD